MIEGNTNSPVSMRRIPLPRIQSRRFSLPDDVSLLNRNEELISELQKYRWAYVSSQNLAQEIQTLKAKRDKEYQKRIQAEQKQRKLEIELLSSYTSNKGVISSSLNQMRIEYEENLRSVREELQEEIRELQESVKEKSLQILRLEEKEMDTMNAWHVMESKISELTDMKHNLIDTLVTTRKAVKEAEGKVLSLTAQKSLLVEENEDLRTKLLVYSKEKDFPIKAISTVLDKRLEAIQKRHKSNLSEVIIQLKESLGENSRIEEENMALKEQILKMERKIERIQIEHKNQIRQINEKLVEEREIAYREINEVKYENARMEGLVQNLNLKIEELKVTLDASNQEEFSTDCSDDPIVKLRNEFAIEHALYDQKIAEELSHLSHKNKKLSDQVRHLENELQLQREINNNNNKELLTIPTTTTTTETDDNNNNKKNSNHLKFYIPPPPSDGTCLEARLGLLKRQLKESPRRSWGEPCLGGMKEENLGNSTLPPSPPSHLEDHGVVLY